MVAATVKKMQSRERRANDRRPIARRSTVRDSDRAPSEVLIHELSPGGCRFAASDYAVGDRVLVGLDGAGQVAGQIVWRRHGLVGCVFDEPLDGARFAEAFTGTPVVTGGFAAFEPLPEPVVEKWPVAARLAILFGGATLLWGAIAAVALALG